MSEIYEKLAKHLDTLPGGFPRTDSGVELKILKRLFTPEEAELAASLTMNLETAPEVAARLGRDESGLSETLESMSLRGLLYRSSRGGVNRYMAIQFVVGIWEYQVNNLSEGLIKEFNEYVPTLVHSQLGTKTKQLRTIPVSKSISAEMKIMPYEKAEEIIRTQSKIVVAPCICRKEHAMIGEDCKKPLETCITFGAGAYYYEENGLGHSISQEEAIEILDKAVEAGLVLQPGNALKPTNICMCCGCCCQMLINVKSMEKPALYACSSFYAAVDKEECTGCGVCEERCPMDAITMDDDLADVDTDRCIGCGVCAASCEFESIALKEKEERWVPPGNMVETYMNIAKERGLM